MNDKQIFTIIQLGNDQLTSKATYYPNELRKYNIETFYFSEDRSGLSKDTIKEERLEAMIAPKNLIARWVKLFLLFVEKKPISIELYLSQRPWHLFYYYLLARFFGSRIIIWCRGELRNYFTHHPLRRLTNKFLLKNADHILLRELYMKEVLQKADIYKEEKTTFFPNAIPIKEVLNVSNYNSKNVLFLNSFKRFRNVELIIEAAEILNNKLPDIKFKIVGSTFDNEGYSPSKKDYEIFLRDLVHQKKLDSVVTFYPFSSDRFKYFEDAFVFVLPADIVFCNYSLLEAMSQKIPAIVADTEGSDLIVDNKKSGFIVEKIPAKIAEAIETLFSKKSLIKDMGNKSREKIIKDYNVVLRAKALCKLYKGS
tara:strand:+ start:236 stop:1339 length:1104 start_codon:yes stop_codon:yes gene_type:complete